MRIRAVRITPCASLWIRLAPSASIYSELNHSFRIVDPLASFCLRLLFRDLSHPRRSCEFHDFRPEVNVELGRVLAIGSYAMPLSHSLVSSKAMALTTSLRIRSTTGTACRGMNHPAIPRMRTRKVRGFGDRRHMRDRLRTPRPGDGQRLEAALLDSGTAAASGMTATSISPAISAVWMCPSPRNGTATMSTPAACLSISIVRCSGLPVRSSRS